MKFTTEERNEMAHAPECSGRIYGCQICGRNDLTIGETFGHDCIPSSARAVAYSAVKKNGQRVNGWTDTRENAELLYGKRGWQIIEIDIVVPEA